MTNYKKFFGRELELMLTKHKPMSAFCRGVDEEIDEFWGQDFFSHVKNGELLYFRFFIEEPYGRIIYSVFTVPEQKWRFAVYRALKKEGRDRWSLEQEKLESYLLGYDRDEPFL